MEVYRAVGRSLNIIGKQLFENEYSLRRHIYKMMSLPQIAAGSQHIYHTICVLLLSIMHGER